MLHYLSVGYQTDSESNNDKLFKNERASALGKAASSLSFEVQNIVRRIESYTTNKQKKLSGQLNDEMQIEIDRLKRLLEGLGQIQ